MKRKEIYHHFIEQLLPIYSKSEAQIIADQVFQQIATITKSDILINGEAIINDEIKSNIFLALKELLEHKPLQQVLQQAWFYKLRFKINEHVLIPRPETEELVELVIKEIREREMCTILDIGTGSGCIPIAIKKNAPEINMYSVDVSKEAIQLAKKNTEYNNVYISFFTLDFLDEDNWNLLPQTDIIVSNPPYIPLSEKANMDKNVLEYEPHLALFVPDDNPLLFYKKIADFGKTHLRENGKILVEIYEEASKDTFAVFEKNYTNVELIKDLFGKFRFLVATKK